MKVAKKTFCILWVIDKNIETQKSPEEFPFLITRTKLLFTTCQGKCFLLFSKSVLNCSQSSDWVSKGEWLICQNWIILIEMLSQPLTLCGLKFLIIQHISSASTSKQFKRFPIFYLRTVKLLKFLKIHKRLQCRYFPVNIVEFLRTAFLWNNSGGCFCIFLKVVKQPFRKRVKLNRFLKKCPCYDVLIFFLLIMF